MLGLNKQQTERLKAQQFEFNRRKSKVIEKMENSLETTATLNVGKEIECTPPKQPSQIIFNGSSQEWIMKLSRENGVEFNRESFSDYTPDEFALSVIAILEQCFTIKFERTEPPYNKDA